MPKEIAFEGGKVIKTGMDIVLIHKQDVEFTDPPTPKSEKDRIKHQGKMIEFIHQKGFHIGMESPEHRFLLVDEGSTGGTLTGTPSAGDVMFSVPANTGTVSFTITAMQDSGNIGDDIEISLGTPLPGNYTAGTNSTWRVKIHDDD